MVEIWRRKEMKMEEEGGRCTYGNEREERSVWMAILCYAYTFGENYQNDLINSQTIQFAKPSI